MRWYRILVAVFRWWLHWCRLTMDSAPPHKTGFLGATKPFLDIHAIGWGRVTKLEWVIYGTISRYIKNRCLGRALDFDLWDIIYLALLAGLAPFLEQIVNVVTTIVFSTRMWSVPLSGYQIAFKTRNNLVRPIVSTVLHLSNRKFGTNSTFLIWL